MRSKEIDLGKYIFQLSQLYSFYTYSKGALTHPTSIKNIADYEGKQMVETMTPYLKNPEGDNKDVEKSIQTNMPKIVADNIQRGLKTLLGLLFESAFSSFEKFLNNVVRAYFWTFPQVLKSIEKQLNYRDIVDHVSFESLFDSIVEKEIDHFSRLSLNNKKDYLKNKFNLADLDGNNIWVRNGDEMWKDIDRKRQAVVHKEEDPNIDESYLLKAINYLQRAMMVIGTIAQVKNGIPIKFSGFEEVIIKKEPPTL